MNERDGHEMLIARMKALKAVALRYAILHYIDTATSPFTDAEVERMVEAEVEKLAPGCSHAVKE